VIDPILFPRYLIPIKAVTSTLKVAHKTEQHPQRTSIIVGTTLPIISLPRNLRAETLLAGGIDSAHSLPSWVRFSPWRPYYDRLHSVPHPKSSLDDAKNIYGSINTNDAPSRAISGTTAARVIVARCSQNNTLVDFSNRVVVTRTSAGHRIMAIY
jgi:hypothetical protein